MEFKDLSDWGVDLKETLSRFIDDKDFYVSCLHIFTSEDEFEVLDDSIKKEDYQKAFEVAHSLKGLTGNLGLTPLYEKLCIFVESLRNKDYSNIKEEYQEIIEKRNEFLGLMNAQ